MTDSPSAGHHEYAAALAPISEAEIDEAIRTMVAFGDATPDRIAERTRRDPTGRDVSPITMERSQTAPRNAEIEPRSHVRST